MSRPRPLVQPCGCVTVLERSGREVWGPLCDSHAAEHAELHARAQRDHIEEARLRALEEELT